MPELRKDPVIGRWVIISTERAKRPSDFASVPPPEKSAFCPFCPGHEDKTPPEILAAREPNTKPDEPGWRVRVVPNKFPALELSGHLNREGEGIYDKMNGVGAHEVIIETPDHEVDLSALDEDHIAEVIRICQERMLDLQGDTRLRYILLFKNQGVSAGASLEHTHMQLIATPILPKRVIEELEGAKRHYDYKERCIFCDIVREETRSGRRVVVENEYFVAVEPFAPRIPYETWILPRKHDASFEYSTTADLLPLASVLKESLQRINATLSFPPYNFMVHTAPCKQSDLLYYHWHIEIMPKLTRVAGFEWGSGFYINPVSPEDAAIHLREVSLDSLRERRESA